MYWKLVPILLVTMLSTSLADRVPVMIWSNDQSVTFPAVLAGHTVSTANFERDYIDQYGGPKKNLIVFVQNKLSIADISHYANIYGFEDERDAVFSNVKALMSEETSTHLPNVISPFSVFEGNKRDVKILSSPHNMEDLFSELGSGEALGLVLVKLNDVDSSDYQNFLRSNDKIIGDVIRQLEKHEMQYTALYTAVSSGRKSGLRDTSLVDSIPRRQLLAATSDQSSAAGNSSAFFNVSDAIYFYVGGIAIANSSSGSAVELDLEHLGYDQDHSSEYCNSTSTDNSSACVIVVKYGLNEPFANLSLKFSFALSTSYDYGYWYIRAAEISYNEPAASGSGTEIVVSEELNVAPIGSWSPLKYSFSCGEPGALVSLNKTHRDFGPHVYLKKFQVQAYGGFGNTGFGYYNDCQPFFSIGIWMALICIAVMISILVFGLYMLCQISTMDRFDDPKGKTIIVAAATD